MKRQTKSGSGRWICLALLLLVLLLAIPSLPREVKALDIPNIQIPVNIPDPNLRSALYKACGKTPSVFDPMGLTNKDLAKLTGTLNVSQLDIKDLDGIQYCVNITELGAAYNPLTSLPNMRRMEGLKVLYLNNCEFSEVPSAISKIANLETDRVRIVGVNSQNEK